MTVPKVSRNCHSLGRSTSSTHICRGRMDFIPQVHRRSFGQVVSSNRRSHSHPSEGGQSEGADQHDNPGKGKTKLKKLGDQSRDLGKALGLGIA